MDNEKGLDDLSVILSLLGEVSEEYEDDSDGDFDEQEDESDVDDDENSIRVCCRTFDPSDDSLTKQLPGDLQPGDLGNSISLVGYNYFQAMNKFQKYLLAKTTDYVASGKPRSESCLNVITAGETGSAHEETIRNNVFYYLISHGYSAKMNEQDIVVDLVASGV